MNQAKAYVHMSDAAKDGEQLEPYSPILGWPGISDHMSSRKPSQFAALSQRESFADCTLSYLKILISVVQAGLRSFQ